MLRTCNVCGGIHQEDKMCKRKYTSKKNSKANSFRNTNAWIIKREQIKRRDKYLCQVCLKNGIYTYNNLQVHHIIPINIDYSKRLDSDNLITLCTYHHNQAEKGLITREQLLETIDPPPGSKQLKIIFLSTPTAHLNSHNYKFSVSFLENKTNKRVLGQTPNTQFF